MRQSAIRTGSRTKATRPEATLRNLLRHLVRRPVAELGGEPYTSVASLFAASEPRLGSTCQVPSRPSRVAAGRSCNFRRFAPVGLVAEALEALALCLALGLALFLAAPLALLAVLVLVIEADDADRRREAAVLRALEILARDALAARSALAAVATPAPAPAAGLGSFAALAAAAAGTAPAPAAPIGIVGPDQALDLAHGCRREAHPCDEGRVAGLEADRGVAADDRPLLRLAPVVAFGLQPLPDRLGAAHALDRGHEPSLPACRCLLGDGLLCCGLLLGGRLLLGEPLGPRGRLLLGSGRLLSRSRLRGGRGLLGHGPRLDRHRRLNDL